MTKVYTLIMKSREVSGENNGKTAASGWDSLKEVPFRLIASLKGGKRSEFLKRHDEDLRKRRIDKWVNKVSIDPYSEAHDANSEKRRAHEEAIKSARNENKELEKDMIKARDEIEKSKSEHAKLERIQEITERDFNSILTTEGQLEELVEEGDERIEKRPILYEGEEITVFDFNGIPFYMLAHDVDFRHESHHHAHWLSQKNIQDPSHWAKSLEEAKQSSKWGSTSGESNTISTSFLSPMTVDVVFKGGRSSLVYGFSHIEAGTIKYIHGRDGVTPNMRDDDLIDLWPGDMNSAKNRVALEEKTKEHDEIQLGRYSEAGEPKKPDYIVVKDGKITDITLKHAAFWHIPIININTKEYDKEERAA